MNTASFAPGGPARCRSNSQAATLQSSSAAFRISKIPTTPLHFPALVQLFSRLHTRIMSSSRGKRATHSVTTTLLNSAGAGASIAVTPGSVDGPRSTSKRDRSVIMCVIVGDVPNSSYMLRFTQEHACLRISTKPVDMPEDGPQTPHAPTTATSEKHA